MKRKKKPKQPNLKGIVIPNKVRGGKRIAPYTLFRYNQRWKVIQDYLEGKSIPDICLTYGIPEYIVNKVIESIAISRIESLRFGKGVSDTDDNEEDAKGT